MVAQEDPPDLLPESKYTIALERQLESLHFMRTRKPYNTVARHIVTERHDGRGLGGGFKDDFSQDTAVAEALARATPYYWGGEMNRELLGTTDATRLPGFVLTAGVLPDECGYVWLERPIGIAENDPEEIRALVWEPVTRAGGAGYAITAFTGYPQGQNMGLPSMHVATGSPRTPVHWRAGDTLHDLLEQIALQYQNHEFRQSVRVIAGMPAHQHQAQLQRIAVFFAAMVDLMTQRITRVAGARGDRASRRRAQALLGKPDVPITRVVLLRPIDYITTGEPSEPGEGDPVQWTHRWEVRRHQRQQRYGPGRSLVRTIWIDAHTKGPAGLPFVRKQPIKAVVR